MIKGMNHVGISVANLERAIAFYRDAFGMELATEFDFGGPQFSSVMGLEGATGRIGVVRKGGLMLELFEFANPKPQAKDDAYPVSDHGISHFGVDVEDIEGVYARLVAQGVRFHCPVTTFPSGMKATYGRDMDGNVFELLEMGPPPLAQNEAMS